MSPLHHLLKLSIRSVYVFSSVSLQKPPSQGLLSTTSPSQELGNCTRSADLVFCILRMHPFMPAAAEGRQGPGQSGLEERSACVREGGE
eukprot:CAMPEP_0171502332 /NCGR_PEP_ID=MMETSP0958-20121227/10107_1 /TAXON_ID=87120 /ORGANISM="Aurantiochytrium limacinum, Strain ATCCMYA-1381" /LENGTH=88 /DNA_ID=CAMNT_0012037351 /DNA_START=118 /DNA_END=382 /DNA_ORIENTATION=-